MHQALRTAIPLVGSAIGAAAGNLITEPYEHQMAHAATVLGYEAPRPEMAPIPYIDPIEPGTAAPRDLQSLANPFGHTESGVPYRHWAMDHLHRVHQEQIDNRDAVIRQNEAAVAAARAHEFAVGESIRSTIHGGIPLVGATLGGLGGLAIRGREEKKLAAWKPKQLMTRGAQVAGAGVLLTAPAAALGAAGLDAPLITPDAKSDVATFHDKAVGWQQGGDIRQMAHEYVTHGSRAASAKIGPLDLEFGSRAAHAANTNSAKWDASTARHYQAFAEGPTSAYLTRAREFEQQYEPHFGKGGREGIDYLYGAAHRNMDKGPVDIRHDFDAAPKGFYAKPGGEPASESLRQAHADSFHRLLADIKPDLAAGHAKLRSLRPDGQPDDPVGITDALEQHARNLANSKGWTNQLKDLTPRQQDELYRDLDPYVHKVNPQHWVDKQFVDFTLGRDAPEAGTVYQRSIEHVMPLVDQAAPVHHTGEQAYQVADVVGQVGHGAEMVGGAGLAVGAGLSALQAWRRHRASKQAEWDGPAPSAVLRDGLASLASPNEALERDAKVAVSKLVRVVGSGLAGGLAGKTLGLGVNALLPDMPQDPLAWENLVAPLSGAIVGSNIGQVAAKATFDPRKARVLNDPSNLPAIAAGLH